MKKRLLILSLLAVILCLGLLGCGGGSSNKSDSKTAIPYPAAQVSDLSISDQQFVWDKTNSNNQKAFQQYLLATFGGTGVDDLPSPIDKLYNPNNLYTDPATGAGYPIIIHAEECKKVHNAILNEYCDWTDPNNVLSITDATVDATSITDKITTSLSATLNLAKAGIGAVLSASITHETTTTVAHANALAKSFTYNLNLYDQSKQYKVILVGDYTYTKYQYSYIVNAGTKDNPDYIQMLFLGNTTGWDADPEALIVDQSSLQVRLVSRDKPI